MYQSINEQDYKGLTKDIVCNVQNLSVAIEGRPLLCFTGYKPEHIRRYCEAGILSNEG